MIAAERDDLSTVLFLLGKGVDVNVVVEGRRIYLTALQASLSGYQRSFDIFHLLLKHGAKINALISRVHGRSELAFAVKTGNIVIVQHLLKLEADVNYPPAEIRGVTAL